MALLMLIHCGAGSSPDMRSAAQKAGARGMELLLGGASALDAVEEAVVILEDDERLNAGTGSRLNIEGEVEMDAAIMDSEMSCGAVAAIRGVKNPIRVARKVMESPHVLLVGDGAVRFARRMGFEAFDPTTQRSKEILEEARTKLRAGDLPPWAAKWKSFHYSDTVGALAMDERGRFAVASSTGGIFLKLPGRVGDTPLIGCGLYAGPKGAVAATGIGEEIIRHVLSKWAYDRLDEGIEAQRACDMAIGLVSDEISVGVVAIDRSSFGVACNKEMAWWCSGFRQER